jgi:putative membrane protein
MRSATLHEAESGCGTPRTKRAGAVRSAAVRGGAIPPGLPRQSGRHAAAVSWTQSLPANRGLVQGVASMLWLKAFHVVAMVTWFAGLFYLPRLFVYHAEATDALSLARFQVMERRLFAIMTIGAVATVVLGVSLIVALPAYLHMHWLHAKLFLVALLIVYHGYCYQLLREFAAARNVHSSKWYRAFNEVPSLLLVGIVLLAVAKPF